jgi:hypothetical protein
MHLSKQRKRYTLIPWPYYIAFAVGAAFGKVVLQGRKLAHKEKVCVLEAPWFIREACLKVILEGYFPAICCFY